MAGPFDHLHIKGRTAGTSNELSFDVLDAVRSEPSQKKARSVFIPSGPRQSQGSYTGVAGTSTLSAVPEVERRHLVRLPDIQLQSVIREVLELAAVE